MADTVGSQTILDGERLFIGKYTNISDGTGDTTKIFVYFTKSYLHTQSNTYKEVKVV